MTLQIVNVIWMVLWDQIAMQMDSVSAKKVSKVINVALASLASMDSQSAKVKDTISYISLLSCIF